MEEIEVKILEMDPAETQARLVAAGAEWEFDHELEALFFDWPDGRLRAKGDLLRLRREGPVAVLTYKAFISQTGAKVMRETETTVGDFGVMREILLASGWQITKETKKRRIQYRWRDCHVVIDDYEGELAAIPPFVEIEAPSVEALEELRQTMGWGGLPAYAWSTYELAKHYGLG